jgi:hypothetical protein
MSRFEREGVRQVSALQAVLAIGVTALLLVLFSGGSVEEAAADLDPGIGQDLIDVVAGPTSWVADNLPLADLQADVTAGLSPDTELDEGGFAATTTETPSGAERIPPVTPESFDPSAIGAEPGEKLPLDKLLVTGDSLSQPLDAILAQRLAEDGVEVARDPKLGSGVSNAEFLDWGQVATAQVRDEAPDAVVVFIGAGEGYVMDGPDGKPVECCGPDWAAIYANRVRQMMDTYRQDGAARVYWINVPKSRANVRNETSTVVNEAVRVAAVPWLSQVRVIDMDPVFSPDGEYTDAIEVDGEETIVRESDGLHLNQEGAEIAADIVMEKLDADFER